MSDRDILAVGRQGEVWRSSFGVEFYASLAPQAARSNAPPTTRSELVTPSRWTQSQVMRSQDQDGLVMTAGRARVAS